MKKAIFIILICIVSYYPQILSNFITGNSKYACLLNLIENIKPQRKPSYQYSSIITPVKDNPIFTDKPLIGGIVLTNKGKPVKQEKVELYIDEVKSVVVQTDDRGLWRYAINEVRKLSNGSHSVHAVTQKDGVWVGSTQFIVNNTPLSKKIITRAGNADPNISVVYNPVNNFAVSNKVPAIVGQIFDSNYNPVSDETINIIIDGIYLGSAISDQDGLWAFYGSEELEEGSHTLLCHADQTNVDLIPITFVVDTQPVLTPIINSPTQLETVNSNIVSIGGTAKPFAAVYLGLDSNQGFFEIALADSVGAWSTSLYFDNGPHSVEATAIDLAFNVSPTSDIRNFNVAA